MMKINKINIKNCAVEARVLIGLRLVITRRLFLVVSCLFVASALAEPYDWSVKSDSSSFAVEAVVAADAYLSAAATSVTATDSAGKPLAIKVSPLTKPYTSPTGEKEDIYPTGAHAWIFSTDSGVSPFSAQIAYQGCLKGVCLLPKSLILTSASSTASTTATGADSASLLPPGWQVKTKLLGMADTADFLAFLRTENTSTPADIGKNAALPHSWIWLLGIAILAGMGLNLTPCVLPLIPVNLGIIGVSSAGNRRTGILLGTAFGGGMTLAYGSLGLLSVFTGAKFGALNSSPIFNFVVAAIMILLTLATLDIFSIDFSGFQAKIDPTKFRTSKILTALILGIFSALLAGACVAPILIAILVWASTLYAEGNPVGLLLPFATGLGMGLPYALLGAGLSILPKPGAWMLQVKRIFAVLLLVVAGFFIYTGITLLRPAQENEQFAALEAALTRAATEGKLVLIDFWATWCKNCKAMDSTTLADPQVQKTIGDKFIFVKFQAEHPTQGRTAALLDQFAIPGLPAFIILERDTISPANK